MSAKWLTTGELVAAVGIMEQELAWYQEHFREQLRLLSHTGEDGQMRYSADAVLLLRGLSGMKAQGATAEQIKGWFGLAAAQLE